MPFFQDPPRLDNTFDDDPLLQEYLARTMPEDLRRELEPELRELGQLSGGRLYELQLADRLNEPVLTQWDAWGHRVDNIEVTPLWKEAQILAARHGLVATAYEQKQGERSRAAQFAKLHVLEPSMDVYSCPLAMTDGATRTLLDHQNQALIDRAVPRLTSRDPARMWTSGQWMTERTGGSDVGLSETVARIDGGQWRLYGTKWFTSATTSQMTLTLARPDGNGPGGRGLALFYLELRDDGGRYNGIQVNRLKDKLGTRKVPTAELTLDGTRAIPVAGLADGVRNISSMLNITRTWNAVCTAAGMQRGLQLARDFSRRRVAFGAPLSEKPLHADTLMGIEAEAQGAFLLAFRAAELIGRKETGTLNEEEGRLLRVLTPIAKLTTGKQGVAGASEVLEAFGGAGYVEDTGLPRLLRDAQVLPIWEGTTNVLSLDTLRALSAEGSVQALQSEIGRHLAAVRSPELKICVETARQAAEHAASWLSANLHASTAIEAGARRFALTIGRTLELALSAEHADWCLTQGRGTRAADAARRLAREGVDRIFD
jgi:alkylation response protein AidB-like acyl-CoA dehydrogenase